MKQFSNETDSIRIQCVIKFDSLIKRISLSKKIEQSIYNYIIKLSKEKTIYRSWENPIFKKLYFSKIRSIYSNLQKTSYVGNLNFLERILQEELDVSQIGELPVYDIYPENWSQLMEEKTKRDKIKYELKPEAMTNTFKCNKCGSRETSYYEVQTRSADEPMTQFINCLNCNNRWKQ